MATGEDLEWAEFWTRMHYENQHPPKLPKPKKRKKG